MSRRITLTRGKKWQTSQQKYSVGANQLVGRLIQFIFALYCGGQHIHGRPIELFHSILQDLLAARTAPMSIHGRLYMAPRPAADFLLFPWAVEWALKTHSEYKNVITNILDL